MAESDGTLVDTGVHLLVEALEGRRVVSVEASDDVNTLVLDDGTRLGLVSDYDCCHEARGVWEINGSDAIITKVEVTVDPEIHPATGRITVLHNGNPVARGDIEASDGNCGYYFTTLSVEVTFPDGATRSSELLMCKPDFE